MTPGSVAMLLGETTGLRVQTTVAGARRGERAHPGASRTLLAARGRRAAALRRAGRLVQPAAGAAARSRTGRDHQRRGLGPVRSVGARRRDQSRLAPAGRGRARAADQRHVAVGPGRDLVARAADRTAGTSWTLLGGYHGQSPTAIWTTTDGSTSRRSIAWCCGRAFSTTTARARRCSLPSE